MSRRVVTMDAREAQGARTHYASDPQEREIDELCGAGVRAARRKAILLGATVILTFQDGAGFFDVEIPPP